MRAACRDPPLTERGVAQARATGRALRDKGIEHIYSSPFLRCMMTAREIADELGLPIRIEEGITEFMNRNWFSTAPTYLHPDQIAAVLPTYDHTYTSQMRSTFPETVRDAYCRYSQAANSLLKLAWPENGDKPHGGLLLVTHGNGVQFICQSMVPSADVIKTPYCCLTKIAVRGTDNYALELLTDDSHLGDIGDPDSDDEDACETAPDDGK